MGRDFGLIRGDLGKGDDVGEERGLFLGDAGLAPRGRVLHPLPEEESSVEVGARKRLGENSQDDKGGGGLLGRSGGC